MLKNLNATKKGLITAVLMIGLSLIFFYSKQAYDNPYQYIIYVVYTLGVVWTLFDFARKGEHSNKFGEFFLQGFKCYIVVTLLMVVFTLAFNKLHPEFRDQMAEFYRKDLLAQKDKTPVEIETIVKQAKDYYIVMLISGAIFVYLIIGTVVSLVTTLLLRSRK
jgi:hypothetical protein